MCDPINMSLDLNHPPVDLLCYQPPIWRCSYCRKIFPSAQSLGGHQNAHRKERLEAKGRLLKLSRASQNEIIRLAKSRATISSSSNSSARGPKSFNDSLPPPPLATPPPRLGRYNPPAHLKVKLAHWPFSRFGSSSSVRDRPVEGFPKFRKKSKKPTAEKSPHPPADDHRVPPSHKQQQQQQQQQQLTFKVDLTLSLNPPPAGELGSDVSASGKGKVPWGLDLNLKL